MGLNMVNAVIAKGKVGRNDPCPCGSGSKYKKCCLNQPVSMPDTVPAEILKKITEFEKGERERIEQYGHVRPQIATDFKGYKMVAVGSTVHYSKNWRFFPDFLKDYLPAVFGREWGQAELARPFEEQHQAVQLRTKSLEFMKRQPRNAAGYYDAVPNGFMLAYLSLAYDLYVVQHNGRLDEDLLSRLKHRDQFQGARHELFAEATCFRAGFKLEHEDEKDRSKRHAEFIATHERTGQKVAVEAKSKHRPGVLGRQGEPELENEVNLRFGKLLNDAIAKKPVHPLAVFLDTNLPPDVAAAVFRPESMEPYAPPRVIWKLLEAIGKQHGGRDPYNLVVFTNHPHHYGKEDEDAPASQTLSIASQVPQLPIEHLDALQSLHVAANLHANIPNEFPQED